jgi:hypothetical protein
LLLFHGNNGYTNALPLRYTPLPVLFIPKKELTVPLWEFIAACIIAGSISSTISLISALDGGV